MNKQESSRWYKATVMCCAGKKTGHTYIRDVLAVNMSEAQRKLVNATGPLYRVTGIHYAGTWKDYAAYCEAVIEAYSDNGPADDD